MIPNLLYVNSTDGKSSISKDELSITSTNNIDSGSYIKVYDDIEVFDQNLPPTATLLKNDVGSKVWLYDLSFTQLSII